MISRAQITKRASEDGVDARVVERDYVLAHVVALISAHDTQAALVFKGGASLRLLHFDEYRYSADVDYSLARGSEMDAHELIRGAFSQPRSEAITELSLDGAPPRINYVGPLGAKRTIKLDIADDELVVNTEKRPLLKKRWPDLPDVTVNAYTRLEIAAEKLRCILQRLQCRDLLDLALLFEEGIDPADAAELFRRKAAHRRLDAKSFASKYEQRVVDYEPRWDRELVDSLAEVPHFDEIERSVRRTLRKAQLL